MCTFKCTYRFKEEFYENDIFYRFSEKGFGLYSRGRTWGDAYPIASWEASCGSDPVFRQIPTGTLVEKTWNSLENKGK